VDETLDELDERLQKELGDDERLVWWGRPSPKRYARTAWGLAVFGIPWTAFVILWISLACAPLIQGQQGAFAICFPLWGIPFLLVGIWMLTAPLRSRKSAKQVCYGLTNQRLIIVQPGQFGIVEVQSILPANFESVTRKEYTDGSGDLLFGAHLANRNQDDYSRAGRHQNAFIGIQDVREVEALIRRTLNHP
jgi:hypothetical protein